MVPTFKAYNGVDIPAIGLGTYLIRDEKEAERVVIDAISAGYRSFDTAMFYFNEGGIGKGIKNSGVDRKDIYVTTKLWNDSHGYEKTLKAFAASLKRLNMEYVDEYLIHWPGLDDGYISTWKAFEKLYKDGLARVIGVSNFTKSHLQKLIDNCEIKPMVNQIEVNPVFQPNDAIAFCKQNDIIVEGYRPIIWGKLDKEPIISIAKKYNKTNVQVTLRWLYQRGIRTLPKTTHKERMIENIGIFDFSLDESEVTAINKLNTWIRTAESPDEFFWNGEELIEKYRHLGY